MTKTSSKYSPEVRARAVRMVQEHAADHPSEWAAISSIAGHYRTTGPVSSHRDHGVLRLHEVVKLDDVRVLPLRVSRPRGEDRRQVAPRRTSAFRDSASVGRIASRRTAARDGCGPHAFEGRAVMIFPRQISRLADLVEERPGPREKTCLSCARNAIRVSGDVAERSKALPC